MTSGGLLLLRHGQSTWNAEGRWQGLADPPLTELGIRQAEEVARALVGSEDVFSAVYCSDLQRARVTAETVANELGLSEPVTDPRLRERDVGDWSGMTSAEIEERWPEVAEIRAAGEILRPYGANNDGYEQRTMDAINEIADKHPGELVVVVSHGGLLRTVERELSGANSDKIPNLCGRWIEQKNNKLVLGEYFELVDFKETSVTNVL